MWGSGGSDVPQHREGGPTPKYLGDFWVVSRFAYRATLRLFWDFRFEAKFVGGKRGV